MPYDLRGLFQLGADILSSRIDKVTRKVLLQVGNVVGEVTDTDNVEQIQHNGFVSRPPNPQKGKTASQAFIIRRGDHDVSIGEQDQRGRDLAGELGAGETCAYAAGADGKAQGRVLIKGDGSVNLLTKKGNTTDGASIAIMASADGSVRVVTPSGAAILIEDDGSVKIFNANGAVQVTQGGSVKLSSTAKVDISAPSVTIGGPSALPLATGPQVVAAIQALQTQVATQAAAWAALGALTGPILGAMLQPIAAPIAGITTAQSLIILGSIPLMQTKRVAAD